MTNPFESDPITISKLDAARRQLSTATELWFTEGDEVSALALAYAAHEIIHRLYRNAGFNNLIYDSVWIKDEYRGEFAKMIKEAPNFIKHAKIDDPESTVTFRPGLIAMFILMSSYAVAKLGKKLNDTEKAAMMWFSFYFPSNQFIDSMLGKGLPIDALKELTSDGRKHFFDAFLRVVDAKRSETGS